MNNIKAIIWDFDGVFYDVDGLPNKEFYNLCDRSCAEAMSNILPNVSYENAKEIANKSYKNYNNNVTGFLPYAKVVGIDEEEFKLLVHENYHSRLFENVLDECPNLIAGSGSLSDKFSFVSKHITHAILSHADTESWLNPVLKLRGDYSYIDQKYVWGMEKFDFIPKSESADPISKIMTKMGVNSNEVMFVEDSLTNLEIAKKAFPDITTVFIKSASRPVDENRATKFADVIVHNMEEALDRVLENTVYPRINSFF